MVAKSLKKRIFILFILFLPIFVIGQRDSVFGTYKTYTYRNTPIIKLFPDGTFSYTSPMEVGDTYETFGEISFVEDTVFFNYKEKIHPEITSSTSRFNPEHSDIVISVNGGFYWHESILLYVDDQFSKRKRVFVFDSCYTVRVDSIEETDGFFIHVGMHSLIPISIDFLENNEFNFEILLPPDQTVYYLEAEKALLKNGLMYFSMTEDGMPFYNTKVYREGDEREKIRELIYERRRNLLNKIDK